MKRWPRRIRGAVGMGLVWAAVWAPAGVLLGMIVDPDGAMDEMWVAVGAYPGFLGGVVFSAVLAVAAGRRRLEQLSLPRVAAWGAAAGLLVGALPSALGASTAEHPPSLLLAAAAAGAIALLSAASAAGSLALARRAEAPPRLRPAAPAEPVAAAPRGDTRLAPPPSHGA